MQQVITAKLKLITTAAQHDSLRQTQLAYRDSLNFVSKYAFEHGKISNEKRLHQGTYYDIRALFKLPSEMTNNAIRQVGATYKGLWTKAKKTTKKRYKGLDKPPKYMSPTIMYNYGYDYGFKSQQQISIRTLEKRIYLIKAMRNILRLFKMKQLSRLGGYGTISDRSNFTYWFHSNLLLLTLLPIFCKQL